MRSLKLIALQGYRLAILVALAMLIRTHHVRLRIGGDSPITISEVREVFPEADSLSDDAGPKAGMHVYDHAGRELGYVLRTMPDAEPIIGYRGWTDTLVAFNPDGHIAGVRVRSSQDTREHVGDVRDDAYFMKTWNGKSWEEVAGIPPEAHGIEGVSGATMTSMAMAKGSCAGLLPRMLRWPSRLPGSSPVCAIGDWSLSWPSRSLWPLPGHMDASGCADHSRCSSSYISAS